MYHFCNDTVLSGFQPLILLDMLYPGLRGLTARLPWAMFLRDLQPLLPLQGCFMLSVAHVFVRSYRLWQVKKSPPYMAVFQLPHSACLRPQLSSMATLHGSFYIASAAALS